MRLASLVLGVTALLTGMTGSDSMAQESAEQRIRDDSGQPESFESFLKALSREDGIHAAAPPEFVDGTLTLADVIASLYRSYPDIIRARTEAQVISGEITSAYGAFDTKFQAHALTEPTGYYRTNRNGLALARQTWWGGSVSAGYRIGRGYYQPWYKERQTDDGGEFKVALTQRLLRGRAIDPQRVAVFRASLAQQAVGPAIQRAILDVSREAARAYWDWIASGAILQAQRELLVLAEERGEQFEIGVKAGKFAMINLILNQQLVAERRVKQLERELKFRATAFKLGLFLRDGAGSPMPPTDAWLPEHFPQSFPPPSGDFASDLAVALAQRPEVQLLQIELRDKQLDRRLARNDLLPDVNFVAEVSQDMGGSATSANDKGEFELVVGILTEVPIQRRKARGKIRSVSAKIGQTNQKLRLVRDKIGVELQIAYNALKLSSEIVEQSELSLLAAKESLNRYRFAFEKGKIDLIYLNLFETKLNETEIKLIEAQLAWFSALVDMQRVLGLDPLDQAMNISTLLLNDRMGPGRTGPGQFPVEVLPSPDELEKDWQRHTQAPE